MCSEAEAHRSLQDPHWNIPLDKLDAFIPLLYAPGAFISKGILITNLQFTTWSLNFFHQTMTRDTQIHRNNEIFPVLPEKKKI